MSNRFLHNAAVQGLAVSRDLVAAIENARSVDIAVSYLQMSGWFKLRQALRKLPANQVRLLTTDQMNITQPAVLLAALRSGIDVRCYRGNRIYHPKAYVIQGNTKAKSVVILGSANISESGLENGIEAGVQISDAVFVRRLGRWFNELFSDAATEKIDESFIREYSKRWKRAAKARVPVRRISKVRHRRSSAPVPEDLETLDDVFSTIRLPVGTLGFDHAGNNIRNLARALEVISRYPQLGSKEASELHLLGFMADGRLTQLGQRARRSRTPKALAKLWTRWVKQSPDAYLDKLNGRLRSFKHAADRFWRLRAEVRQFFLQHVTNPNQRALLQTIELCCNGSVVAESLGIDDFKSVAPFVLSGKGLSAFITGIVDDYLNNKGSRSWSSDDRRTVLASWH